MGGETAALRQRRRWPHLWPAVIVLAAVLAGTAVGIGTGAGVGVLHRHAVPPEAPPPPPPPPLAATNVEEQPPVTGTGGDKPSGSAAGPPPIVTIVAERILSALEKTFASFPRVRSTEGRLTGSLEDSRDPQRVPDALLVINSDAPLTIQFRGGEEVRVAIRGQVLVVLEAATGRWCIALPVGTFTVPPEVGTTFSVSTLKVEDSLYPAFSGRVVIEVFEGQRPVPLTSF